VQHGEDIGHGETGADMGGTGAMRHAERMRTQTPSEGACLLASHGAACMKAAS